MYVYVYVCMFMLLKLSIEEGLVASYVFVCIVGSSVRKVCVVCCVVNRNPELRKQACSNDFDVRS